MAELGLVGVASDYCLGAVPLRQYHQLSRVIFDLDP